MLATFFVAITTSSSNGANSIDGRGKTEVRKETAMSPAHIAVKFTIATPDQMTEQMSLKQITSVNKRGGINHEYIQAAVVATHGVIDADLDEGILYLTEEPVLGGTSGCGNSPSFPCKITVNQSLIQWDSNGNPYVDAGAQYTAIGQGPYTP